MNDTMTNLQFALWTAIDSRLTDAIMTTQAVRRATTYKATRHYVRGFHDAMQMASDIVEDVIVNEWTATEREEMLAKLTAVAEEWLAEMEGAWADLGQHPGHSLAQDIPWLKSVIAKARGVAVKGLQEKADG